MLTLLKRLTIGIHCKLNYQISEAQKADINRQKALFGIG